MLILKWIEAASLRQLQEVFMQLQASQGRAYNYHPPMLERGRWIITWYEPMENDVLGTTEVLNEVLDGGQPTR